MKKVLLTGAAGLIGAKTAEKLLAQGIEVVGIDNLNDYYDVNLKRHRLSLINDSKFQFLQVDIEDKNKLRELFKTNHFDVVYNLAARAGVRYSMENPDIYMTTNAMGTLNLLECMREFKVSKFVLASTSSLYAGQEMPFKEDLAVNTPISPYAASKKAAEVMAYTYHYLYGIDVSVVRYFTVYGPAGRPDMSPFIFADKILKGEELPVFGDGTQSRDFTFVDDIAEGTILAGKKLGFEIINLGGGNNPYTLLQMIELMEKYSGKKAKLKLGERIKADMDVTWADISKAKRLLGWEPKISFEEGIERLMKWHSTQSN
ncbi:SDR family NAD(P)-dependent oxidoreductase [Peredibacter sp. HCB2-198]|uniref:SDR family NAD(P)-dependent oxidoreductase n=1 Tax=Peredibacter sp. HCB2-198 TaxID=3383025 RepID=UPI0038B57998